MRLGDLDALKAEISSWGMNDYEPSDFIDAIDAAPTVVTEILKGGAEMKKDDVSCQYCKYEDKSETDYPCSICKNNHPNMFEWKETSKPNCVTCDHFGKCEGCEKRDEE